VIPPPLSDDERRIVEWLLESAITTLAIDGGARDVRECLGTALGVLRGEHRPKPRRHRRTRPITQETAE
jgi:hypothetical protein